MRYLSIFSIVLSVFLTSCSAMLLRRSTDIKTNDDAKVYVRGDKVGEGDTEINLMKYNAKNIEVDITKKGYKTRSEVIYAKGFNPWFFLSLVWGPIGLIYEGSNGYHKNFPKEKDFQLEEYPDLKKVPYSIGFSRIRVDSSDITVTGYHFNQPRPYEKGDIPSSVKKRNYLQHFNEGQVKYRMNKFLALMGAYDTTHFNLGNYNHFSVYATVTDYKYKTVSLYRTQDMHSMSLTTKFEVFNQLGNRVYEGEIDSHSGDFLKNVSLEYLFYDALDFAAIALLKDPHLKVHLEKKQLNDNPAKILNYKKLNRDLSQRMNVNTLDKHSFILKTKEGNSVAIPVGKTGLVAVSQKSKDYADTLKLKDYEGNVYDATLVYNDPFKEYALLQIDKELDYVFPIAAEGEQHVGDIIYAFGYETYLDAALLTKGIINAEREFRNSIYYQLDAECNSQVFPAIFNDKGHFVGFVSRSLSNSKISGIAFCPPMIEK